MKLGLLVIGKRLSEQESKINKIISKLTVNQKEAILGCNEDFCIRSHLRTMRAFNDKDLANYTTGYGWKSLGLVELTPLVKEVLRELKLRDARKKLYFGLANKSD